jgi:HEPN domain-containing protein
MSAVEHARALLKSAYRDFRALTGMQDSGLFADEIFGFHAQQAIEKGLKAWIAGLEIEYPRTHDISLLLTILQNHAQDMEPFWELVAYNAFAVQLRYEGLDMDDEQLARDTVIDDVQCLLTRAASEVSARGERGIRGPG